MNVNEAAEAAFIYVLHNSVDLSEQGMVAAQANILASLDLGAALPNENGSAAYQVSAEAFGAQTLGLRIATVP
jgi:hypothetical protein